jgi:hypothetical protein
LTSVQSIKPQKSNVSYPSVLGGPMSDSVTPWVILADPEGNEFCILRGRVRPDS